MAKINKMKYFLIFILNMIPKIVHLTTKDGRLNGDETIIMNKNKKIFHDWNFRVYSDTDNLQIITEKFPEFWKNMKE